MPRTPAMTTGTMDFITSSGRMTPMEAIPTPDLAVPYAAPMPVKEASAKAHAQATLANPPNFRWEDQSGPAGQRERAERGGVGRTAEDEGGRGAEEAEEGAHLVAGEVAASKARLRALGEGGEGHKSLKACLHRAHFPLLLSTRLRPLAPCLNAYSDDQGSTLVRQPFFRCCPSGS